MSHQASSSLPSPPVITRAGRVVTTPSLYANKSSVAKKPAAPTHPAEEAAKANERKTKKRAFEEVEEVEESSGEESSGDEYYSVILPEDPDHGCMIMDDLSDSESSEDTVRYCAVCNCSGPAGLMCDAPGCEDSNCVYE